MSVSAFYFPDFYRSYDVDEEEAKKRRQQLLSTVAYAPLNALNYVSAKAAQIKAKYAKPRTAHTQAVEQTYTPAVEQASSKLRHWAAKYAPAAAGFVTGFGARTIAKFALAKLAVTVPAFGSLMAASPLATAIVTAVALGVVGGGLTKLATAYIAGRGKEREKGWKWNAFKQGAKNGIKGAALGFVFAEALQFISADEAMAATHTEKLVGADGNTTWTSDNSTNSVETTFPSGVEMYTNSNGVNSVMVNDTTWTENPPGYMATSFNNRVTMFTDPQGINAVQVNDTLWTENPPGVVTAEFDNDVKMVTDADGINAVTLDDTTWTVKPEGIETQYGNGVKMLSRPNGLNDVMMQNQDGTFTTWTAGKLGPGSVTTDYGNGVTMDTTMNNLNIVSQHGADGAVTTYVEDPTNGKLTTTYANNTIMTTENGVNKVLSHGNSAVDPSQAKQGALKKAAKAAKKVVQGATANQDPTPYVGKDGFLHSPNGQVDPYLKEVAQRQGYDIKLGNGGVYHKVPLTGVAQAAPIDEQTKLMMQEPAPKAPKPTRVAKILFVPVQK